jgi:hypothetical protein
LVEAEKSEQKERSGVVAEVAWDFLHPKRGVARIHGDPYGAQPELSPALGSVLCSQAKSVLKI